MATINIGGKDREYDLSTGAFIIAFENEGVRVRVLDFENPAADQFIPRLAWIGLLPADPELKEATVRQWFVDGQFDYEQLFEAIDDGATAMGNIMDELSAILDQRVNPQPFISERRAAKKALQAKRRMRRK